MIVQEALNLTHKFYRLLNNLDSADYAGSIIARPNNNTTAFELKYTAGGSVTTQGATSLLVQDIAANTFLAGSATYETT